jgi:hypothetical protein
VEYQKRLTALDAPSGSLYSGLPYEPEGNGAVTPPAPSNRQPPWSRLSIAIFTKGKQMLPGNGHARAARREEAWYPF